MKKILKIMMIIDFILMICSLIFKNDILLIIATIIMAISVIIAFLKKD